MLMQSISPECTRLNRATSRAQPRHDRHPAGARPDMPYVPQGHDTKSDSKVFDILAA